LDEDSIPASATTTMSSMLCRAWNCRTIGMIVAVSALLPSKQPISRGNPCPVHQEPDAMTCGSTRRFLGVELDRARGPCVVTR
jgi:hypothetical protein